MPGPYTLSGNTAWSSLAPIAGDNIFLAGFTLTLDGVNGSTYSAGTIAGPGSLAIGAGITSFTLNANLAPTTATMLTIPTGVTVVINGNLIGGSGSTSATAVTLATGGTATITGCFAGALGNALTVTGGTLIVYSYVANGTYSNGTYTGQILGGNSSSAPSGCGIYISGSTSAAINVIGSIYGGYGGVYSAVNNSGILISNSSPAAIIHSGVIYSGTSGPGIYIGSTAASYATLAGGNTCIKGGAYNGLQTSGAVTLTSSSAFTPVTGVPASITSASGSLTCQICGGTSTYHGLGLATTQGATLNITGNIVGGSSTSIGIYMNNASGANIINHSGICYGQAGAGISSTASAANQYNTIGGGCSCFKGGTTGPGLIFAYGVATITSNSAIGSTTSTGGVTCQIAGGTAAAGSGLAIGSTTGSTVSVTGKIYGGGNTTAYGFHFYNGLGTNSLTHNGSCYGDAGHAVYYATASSSLNSYTNILGAGCFMGGTTGSGAYFAQGYVRITTDKANGTILSPVGSIPCQLAGGTSGTANGVLIAQTGGTASSIIVTGDIVGGSNGTAHGIQMGCGNTVAAELQHDGNCYGQSGQGVYISAGIASKYTTKAGGNNCFVGGIGGAYGAYFGMGVINISSSAANGTVTAYGLTGQAIGGTSGSTGVGLGCVATSGTQTITGDIYGGIGNTGTSYGASFGGSSALTFVGNIRGGSCPGLFINGGTHNISNSNIYGGWLSGGYGLSLAGGTTTITNTTATGGTGISGNKYGIYIASGTLNGSGNTFYGSATNITAAGAGLYHANGTTTLTGCNCYGNAGYAVVLSTSGTATLSGTNAIGGIFSGGIYCAGVLHTVTFTNVQGGTVGNSSGLTCGSGTAILTNATITGVFGAGASITGGAVTLTGCSVTAPTAAISQFAAGLTLQGSLTITGTILRSTGGPGIFNIGVNSPGLYQAVNITTAQGYQGVTGSGAVLRANLDATGRIVSVSVLNPGSGYVYAPKIYVDAASRTSAPVGSTALMGFDVVLLNGGINRVIIPTTTTTPQHIGPYTTPPNLTVVPVGGPGAYYNNGTITTAIGGSCAGAYGALCMPNYGAAPVITTATGGTDPTAYGVCVSDGTYIGSQKIIINNATLGTVAAAVGINGQLQLPSSAKLTLKIPAGTNSIYEFMPSTKDVRATVAVGAKTGTMGVPTAAQTLFGVSVDVAGTGTVTLPHMVDSAKPYGNPQAVVRGGRFGAYNTQQGTGRKA